MQRTPYAEINGLLDRLLYEMRRILAEKLVGVYLYGSLTAGDFDLGSSDVDLLTVTSSDIDGAEFEELGKMHRDFGRSNPKWEDRIDVAYPSVTALRTFLWQQSQMAVITPGKPFHMAEAGKGWLMNWYLVRETGTTLFGPPPKSITGRITREEFVQAVREHAAAWGELINRAAERKGQAYAVLTMCRALYTHRNGEQVSKRQAALWAMEQLPNWALLIENALAWRSAWREEQVDHAATHPETVKFVHFVKDLIVL